MVIGPTPDSSEWERHIEERLEHLEKLSAQTDKMLIDRFNNAEKTISARFEKLERVTSRVDKFLDEWWGDGPNDKESMRYKTQKLMEYSTSVRNWGALVIWLSMVGTPLFAIWGFIHGWWSK